MTASLGKMFHSTVVRQYLLNKLGGIDICLATEISQIYAKKRRKLSHKVCPRNNSLVNDINPVFENCKYIHCARRTKPTVTSSPQDLPTTHPTVRYVYIYILSNTNCRNFASREGDLN